MRALIVEDDQTIADFVMRGLKEAGFVVDHAADGTIGLDLASTGAYDVAIVDLMLPGTDGIGLIRALRRGGIRTPTSNASRPSSIPSRRSRAAWLCPCRRSPTSRGRARSSA
jgi:two-component system OmpR family response regulator